MAMSANQLQAMYARRREMDHIRTERSAAVSRYYDHWGKVTSRFENWTRPEYYEQADAQLRAKKEKKEKATKLVERRAKLEKLFAEEQMKYDMELKMMQRSKGSSRFRPATIDVDTLEKIAKQNKEREDIKRKLELEAKLYGRWRHGVDDDNIIFDSKSDHQVLAKLNWLDKKVDEQMQKEKEEAEAQERNLRLQEEKRKMEEAQAERQQLRVQEIQSVQSLQEQHMDALKTHHEESVALREEEKLLRDHTRELQQERELLEETSAYVREPPEIAQAFNLRKVKILTRQRAETFRNQLRLIVNILERMQPYAIQKDKLNILMQAYRQELESEELAMRQLDVMYESEAKLNLQRSEEAWQAQHLRHYNDMKRLIEDEHFMQNSRLKENMERQKEIINLRETHVEAIENSNEQLKKLMEEEKVSESKLEQDVRGAVEKAKKAGAGDIVQVETLDNSHLDNVSESLSLASLARKPGHFGRMKPSTPDIHTDCGSLPKTTSSFQNLNLDVWQERPPSARKGSESPRLQSQRSLQVVTPGSSERPRFARKRVAWN